MTKKIISETIKNGVTKIVIKEGHRPGQKLLRTSYSGGSFLERMAQNQEELKTNPTLEEVLEERKQHYRCILNKRGLPTSIRVPYKLPGNEKREIRNLQDKLKIPESERTYPTHGEKIIDNYVKNVRGFEYATIEEETSRLLMQTINFEEGLSKLKPNDPVRRLLKDAFHLGLDTKQAIWNEDATGRAMNRGKESKKKQWAIDLAESLVKKYPQHTHEQRWNDH